MNRVIAMALCSLLIGAVPASAHHSLSAYSMSTYRMIEGTVKSFDWINPHARLVLMAPGANGRMIEWNFEGGSIGRLSAAGFTRNMVLPGDRIAVAYSPMRNGSPGGFFIAVTTADGKLFATDRFKQLNASGPAARGS